MVALPLGQLLNFFVAVRPAALCIYPNPTPNRPIVSAVAWWFNSSSLLHFRSWQSMASPLHPTSSAVAAPPSLTRYSDAPAALPGLPATASTRADRRGVRWSQPSGDRSAGQSELGDAFQSVESDWRSSGTRPLAPGEPQATDDKVGTIPAGGQGWRAGSGALGAATIVAANAIPMAIRGAYYGTGANKPGSGLESGMSGALVPSRWGANYGEYTTGYQEDRHGGTYLKTLQNTKPLPMWWRYNGKLAPPWFQPNEPLQRAHLLRSPVPVPAPPFRSPFNPGWMNSKDPQPPQPAEFPYKHPMSQPWAGEAATSCPCPGNPQMLCDCLSIQYAVELPVPEKDQLYGTRMDMDRKMRRQTNMVIDMMMQPPLLESLIGIILGLLMNGSGTNRKFPANFAKANQPWLPLGLAAGVGVWLLLSLVMANLGVYPN